ncbi:MAG: hypothetical protein NWR83_05905 [Salibacteraceae bacterium]|nr:hypothetical protein [Salibacteraceae bacterium]
MDYNLLRSEAIENTQKISGNKWTDYNIHDPGVTILEQFCYAITDIAYRTNLSVEELLFTGKNAQTIAQKTALIPAEEIFASGAITEDDYRILFLDQFANKISNCWLNRIEHHIEGIKGLYELVVHLNADALSNDYDKIKDEIFLFYRAHRNLCEDIESIKILKPKRVKLHVEIEIFQDMAAEEIVSEILFKVESYFNPRIKFHSLDVLKESGKGLDEIFDIPSYKHGFIKKNELKPKQNQFYSSKIEDLILEIRGIRALKKLVIFQDGIPVTGDTIKISENDFLTLNANQKFLSTDGETGSIIKLFKGGVQNNYLVQKVETVLFQKLSSFNRSYEGDALTYTPQKSPVKKEEIEEYDSLQINFPLIYGVGNATPPMHEGKERQGQSSQLKAYLMFFDQVMANHLAQLSNLADLISIQNIDVKSVKTYFTQSLSDRVSGAAELLKKTLRPVSELEQQRAILQTISDIDSEAFAKKNADLELELEEKKKTVKKLTGLYISTFLKSSKDKLKRTKLVSDREIIALLLDLKSNDYSVEKQNEIVLNCSQLIEKELNEKEQLVDLSQEELCNLMSKFDNQLDRKNRLLSHMLARFGEQFSTDFHLKFSEVTGGVSPESVERQLIYLKSEFLNQIWKINKYKAQGVDLSSMKVTNTFLQQKVNLLLNLSQNFDASKGKTANSSFKAKRLSGDELKAVKSKEIDGEFLQKANDESDNQKATFIINSAEYLKFLFQFGLHKSNYKIVLNEGSYQVFFTPPTDSKASLLFSDKDKDSAHQRLENLISKLAETSRENEKFFVVEHVLLRPTSYRECRFFLKDANRESIFRSLRIDKEEQQLLNAKDTLILGAYEDNYRISKNEKGDFIVSIKAKDGKLIAESIHSFMTVLKAEDFIKTTRDYYHENLSDLSQNIELDNKLKYFLEVLDQDGVAVLKSTSSSTPGEHFPLLEALLNAASNANLYKITGGNTEPFKAALFNENNTQIAFTTASFNSLNEINGFISRLVSYFSETSFDINDQSLVRFSKLNDFGVDSFNNKLSIVYPDWTARFNNLEFLEIFKRTIISCTPAHLSINFIGLDYRIMTMFEQQYSEFLFELKRASYDNRDKVANLSNQVLKYLVNE